MLRTSKTHQTLTVGVKNEIKLSSQNVQSLVANLTICDRSLIRRGVCVCICVWRGEGELERAPREPEAERESRAGVTSRSRAMLPARWSFTESLSRFFGVRVRTTVRAFTTERSVSCCAATPTRRRTVRVSVWRVRSRKTQRSVYCFAVCEATFYELSPHVHAPIPRARSAARPR